MDQIEIAMIQALLYKDTVKEFNVHQTEQRFVDEWDTIDKQMIGKGPSLVTVFAESDKDDIVVTLVETFSRRCSSICKLDPHMLEQLVSKAQEFVKQGCDVIYFFVVDSKVEVKPFIFESCGASV